MSRIDNFTSQPYMNYTQYELAEMHEYSMWLNDATNILKEPTRETAKRVLGRQDYCWQGSYRNWIWERPVDVNLSDGRVITRHWRLFASYRGFTLEIEDGGRPWGETMREVVPVVWQSFLETWYEGM